MMPYDGCYFGASTAAAFRNQSAEVIEFAWKGAWKLAADALPLESRGPSDIGAQVEIPLEKEKAPVKEPSDNKKKQKSLFDF